jgi:hypothetical protein
MAHSFSVGSGQLPVCKSQIKKKQPTANCLLLTEP